VTLRAFWPIGDAAQADYETLRSLALAGTIPATVAAARFARRGLAGLIAWPTAETVFQATVHGATRAPWTPHNDARFDVLADAFELLLAAPRSGLKEEAYR
jgi:hypothetical protein